MPESPLKCLQLNFGPVRAIPLLKAMCLTIVIGRILVQEAYSQEFVPNYDESKVKAYTLPDPLRLNNGKKVESSKSWKEKRAPELLNLFSDYVYGIYPEGPASTHFEVLKESAELLGGKAIARQVRIYFGSTQEYMDLLLFLPAKKLTPVPVFIGLNFLGNHSVLNDPWIPLTSRWVRNNSAFGVSNNQANETSRGAQSNRWCVEMIIDAGYGVATAYYGDLEPDHAEGWKTGVRTTMQPHTRIKPEQWGALGAWGWGLSRMMDYLETDRRVDARKVIITGHSRLGKAALWAAANDRRFAMVISNDSGEGGTALARRNYGETVQSITMSFPHWFIKKYSSFSDDVPKLPVDQHMLLALMAPRPLYVASAQDDRWADPYGEFLSACYADPVYELFGKKGIGTDKLPETEQPVGDFIRYHIRQGEHDIKPYDWEQFISFCNSHLHDD